MKLHAHKTEVKEFLAKILSQFCLILFLMLFVAAAQGALALPTALLLGAVNIISLNTLCGILLGSSDASKGCAAPRTRVCQTVSPAPHFVSHTAHRERIA